MANRSDSTRTDPSSSLRPTRPAGGRVGSSAPTEVSTVRTSRANNPAPQKRATQAITGSSVKASPRSTGAAKPKSATAAVLPDDERRAMVAKAAYFHAERRGFAPGGEVEDWLAAEAEVDALLAHSSSVRQ